MRSRSRIRFVASASLLAIASMSMAGCASMNPSDITASISSKPNPPTPQSESEWRTSAQIHGDRYRADPKDREAALRYGIALRALGQRAQASAVLEQAAIAHPGDRAILAAFGRAQVDNGNYQQGFETLARAHTPDNPDWHILSIQGTALDRLGKHDEARRYYNNALKIKPDEPSVLSNLGMSYVLSKQLAEAEDALRRAHDGARSDIRVRQNLALVVGLQGRVSEAETIIRADLPVDEANDSVAGLREMLKRDARPPARRADAGRASRS